MAESTASEQSRYDSPPSWLWGAGAALAAFLVYLLTTGAIAFPGRSVDILINFGKVKGAQPLLYPLYDALAGLVVRIPLGNLAIRMAVFSALCAWGGLTLLFGIMSSQVYGAIEKEMNSRVRWIASLGAGLTATVFLAFCMPFWYAANRADYACFHLLIFLGMARLFFFWLDQRRNREWVLYLFAFLYGIGMAEYATFIIFAPLFALSVLVILAVTGRFSSLRIMGMAACGLLGLSLYFWTAWRYYHAPYVLLPASSVYQALVFIVKSQLNMILRGLPKVGWLVVGMTTFVPWLILLPLHKRGLRSETGWSFIGLHLIFSLLVIILLFDFTLAPWRILGEGNFLVTPYLCAAMVFGYLTAFWVVEEHNPWPQSRKAEMETFRKRLARVMAVGMAVLVIVPLFLHFRSNNVRQARVFDVLARNVVQSMGERQWLVTDGVLDNHIRLAARDMGKAIRLMDLSRAEDQRQIKEVADQFESVRLKNQAELGLVPFLQEWMRMDPEIGGKLALMVLPDLWYGAEHVPVPYGLVFLGFPDLKKVDVEMVRQQDRQFWNSVKEMEPKSGTPMAMGMWGHYNRHISLMANNLAVLLEDLEKPQEAYATYGLSRSMDSNNLSALLNQYAMIRGGFPAPDATAITNALAALEVRNLENMNIWNLSRFYGYVRAPSAFAAMGWTWALSGHPGLAVSGLKRAMDLSKNAQITDNMDMTLAALYMSQGQPEESRKIYQRVLGKNQLDIRALLGMAELALRWRRPEEARSYIAQAEAAGATRPEVAQIWALYHMATGENDKARVFLEELVATYSSMTMPWHMLANVMLVQKDAKGMERLAARLKELPKQDYHTCRALAVTAALKEDGPAIRQYLEQALMYKPRDPSTLDLLIRMDMKELRQDLAERHARDLLRGQPDHAYANYVLGTLQIKRREYKLAEDSLSRSLAQRRTTETLNDLAWAILMVGRLDEAEKLAREALSRNSQLAAAWDTLGVVYLKQGKLTEARESIQRALNVMPNLPEFMLHMAQVAAASKDYAMADELIQKVAPHADRMWVEEREAFQNLSREVRENVK